MLYLICSLMIHSKQVLETVGKLSTDFYHISKEILAVSMIF